MITFPPNSLLITLVGAGILWIGWNGFNGGDPYFANADAGAAVLNTNTATAVGLLVWTLMDKMAYGKPSVLGAVNGMIAGLVAITPAAGYVDGWGAIIIGICAGIIPWLSMNKLQKTSLFMKVDDTLSVFSTHGVAGLTGGLLVGLLANPDMLMYIGTDKEAPGVNITGLLYGNPSQLWLQALGAAFIIVYNAIAHLHHPEGDRLHRAAADGRSHFEGRRRRSARRDRLRDRRRRRVICLYGRRPAARSSALPPRCCAETWAAPFGPPFMFRPSAAKLSNFLPCSIKASSQHCHLVSSQR